jgi:peptide/nickel transport system permease protein
MAAVTTTPPIAVSTSSVEAAKRVRWWHGMGVSFWIFVAWLALMVIFSFSGAQLPILGWKFPTLPFVKSEPDYLIGADVSSGKWIESFSRSHLLGVDSSGNDLLTGIITGARNIIIGFVIGGMLGMIAGYRRGKVDGGLSFFMTSLQSFPAILFILMFLSVVTAKSSNQDGVQQGLNANVWYLSFSLAILAVPTLFRVVRASTIQFSQREFVLAARAIGAKPMRVLMREILPNVAKPLLAFGLVGAGTVMVIEGGLSYLGIGVSGDQNAWGKMIQAGAQLSDLKRYPHMAFVPMIALFITVLALNFIGDKIRERLEVKEGAI